MALPSTRPHSFHCSPLLAHAELGILFVDEEKIRDKAIVCPQLQEIDQELSGTLSTLIALGDFEGKWLQTAVTLTLGSQTRVKRIALVGAGKKEDYPPARARQLGIKAAEIFLQLKAYQVAFLPAYSKLLQGEHLGQLRLGVGMGIYKYPRTNLTAEQKAHEEQPVNIQIVVPSTSDSALNHAHILSEAINFCRILQDGGPNIVTPAYVAQQAQEACSALGLTVTVRGRKELEELGFRTMLAVAQGSHNDPKFVVVEYAPASYSKTLALVGKGLTMDTGGYSLKTPSTTQEGMKYDMSGAAVVLSAIQAIAKLKLPVRVYAVAALCENMVDGNSYRVGDIITSYSGKTIEVLNTDAEGRLVLSDALHYAAKDLKADGILEFSTLTGAMIVTFGHIGAGIFAFDKHMEELVVQAGEATGERLYPLPCWDEAAEDMKGTITDLCNIGASRGSHGSMGAAAFLNEFVNDVPFVHVDIAGVADGNKSLGYVKKGGSGYGVQLAVELARRFR